MGAINDILIIIIIIIVFYFSKTIASICKTYWISVISITRKFAKL